MEPSLSVPTKTSHLLQMHKKAESKYSDSCVYSLPIAAIASDHRVTDLNKII